MNFVASPRNSAPFQLLDAFLSWLNRQNNGHLSCSPRHRRASVHDCDVHVNVSGYSMFLTSKALVTSLLEISFYMIFLSSLLSAWRKIIISFQAKLNFDEHILFPHVGNEYDWRSGFYEKVSSKIELLVVVELSLCTVLSSFFLLLKFR